MNLSIVRVFACGIFAVVFLQAAKIAPADNDYVPLTVEVTLAMSSIVTIGEPIMLHYKITNSSDEDASVYQGMEGTDWYTEKITNASGQSLLAAPAAPETKRGGIISDGMVVQAYTSREGYIVASKPFVFTHSGRYTLTVHIQLPYGMGEQAMGVPASQLEGKVGTVLTQDYSTSLNVVPADPTRLLATAESLRKQITSDKTAETVQALVQALFSLPDSVALPSWQELAADPSLTVFARSQVARELSRVLSSEAADLLAGMIWNPAQPYSVVSVSNVNAGLLQDMYRSGGPTLRLHVRDILAEHGLVASDTPGRSPIQD